MLTSKEKTKSYQIAHEHSDRSRWLYYIENINKLASAIICELLSIKIADE